MAQTSPFVPDFAGAAQDFLGAFNTGRDRQLKQKQLEIQQAVAERQISVQEGTLLLAQEEAQINQQAQTDIEGNLQQQADLIRGGGQEPSIQDQLSQQLNLAQAPQLQDPTSAGGGLIDPSLAVSPVQQPEAPIRLTDAMRREQDALSAELLGIKGGAAIFTQFKDVLARGDKRELALAKEDIEDEQRLALSLKRADTREKKNKLVRDEMNKELLENGQIPPKLLQMINMDDREFEANNFQMLAQGEVLQKMVENVLIPPVVKPEARTTLAKNLELAGIDPLSPEGKKIIKESIVKPGVKIDINEGLSGFKVPKGFMFDKDETGKITGVKPIPGSKADRLGAGDAAKVQMIRTAQKAATGIKELIFDKFDKKGAGIELNSTNLFNAEFNTPFTDGRKLRIKMEFGIQGITRSETGAAMPPAEVDNTRIRFMPSIFDTAEIARLKVEMFDDFLSGTLQLIDPSGRFNEDRFGNPVKPTFDKSGNAIELGELNESKFDAELQRRISGTAQTGETGNVLRFDAQGNRL